MVPIQLNSYKAIGWGQGFRLHLILSLYLEITKASMSIIESHVGERGVWCLTINCNANKFRVLFDVLSLN